MPNKKFAMPAYAGAAETRERPKKQRNVSPENEKMKAEIARYIKKLQTKIESDPKAAAKAAELIAGWINGGSKNK